MEMNTRLQVEHPVTEEITGQDLVEWQLRVASGEKLPKTQESSRSTATRSKRGFMPRTRRRASCRASGRLEHFDLGEEGRIETGVEEGDAISPYYDPMIAKLIARGDDREEAIDELAAILDGVEVWPVQDQRRLPVQRLAAPGFRSGDDRHRLHRAQSRRAGARPGARTTRSGAARLRLRPRCTDESEPLADLGAASG